MRLAPKVTIGDGFQRVIDEISKIPDMINVSGLDSTYGYVSRKNAIYDFERSGNVYSLSEDYKEKPPLTFELALIMVIHISNSVFISVPWITKIIALLFYVACILALIIINADIPTMIDPRKEVDSSWTKGGPYV
jgi:hypothetical protein